MAFSILIVDDDPGLTRALQLSLRCYGYDVSCAASGQEALDHAWASAPDLVILDWQMLEMDGIQVCRLLRAGSDVPILMMSANPSNAKEYALAAGANDYLGKPFSIRELLARVEAALRVRVS
jgi:DNA-binding response OmpR family regulator